MISAIGSFQADNNIVNKPSLSVSVRINKLGVTSKLGNVEKGLIRETLDSIYYVNTEQFWEVENIRKKLSHQVGSLNVDQKIS